MARKQTSIRDEKHELSRRGLIKWSLAAGAALGVSNSKIYEILEKTAGKGTAAAAAERATCRLVAVDGGNGGGAWASLAYPQPFIISSPNAAYAWHQPGKGQVMTIGSNQLAIGPDTYFANLPPDQMMTAFQCGTNLTHTKDPQANFSLNGNSVFAVATALQSSSSVMVPVIAVGGTKLGTAPGAATAATVNDSTGIVGLFNSVASKSLLLAQSDAQFYGAQYQAFIQLMRASNRSTTRDAYTTGAGAANFLGVNLADKLTVTAAELQTKYGVTGNTRGSIAAIGKTLATAVKAFAMNLTNAVILPDTGDDPHNAFVGGLTTGDIGIVPPALKMIWDGFMADMTATVDSLTGTPLSRDLVITWTTDTTKNPFQQNGWPDGTPMNSSVMYVWSGGRLKPGWFGGANAPNSVQGFGADGKPTTYNGANTIKLASAAVAYAIAKQDDRAISTFAPGVTISGNIGVPKQI